MNWHLYCSPSASRDRAPTTNYPASSPPDGEMVSISFTLIWAETDVEWWVLDNVRMKSGWLFGESYPTWSSFRDLMERETNESERTPSLNWELFMFTKPGKMKGFLSGFENITIIIIRETLVLNNWCSFFMCWVRSLVFKGLTWIKMIMWLEFLPLYRLLCGQTSQHPSNV